MARAPTNRKSGFIRRGGVMRRETLWASLPFATSTLAASAAAVLVRSGSAALLELRPFTIVRTHLQFRVVSDQAGASEDFVGSTGFCVVTDQAVAVGITAVPTPATDLDSDVWYLLEQFLGGISVSAGPIIDIESDFGSRAVDNKAMRKVEPGSDIIEVHEAGIGGSGCVVQSAGRFLIKLH